MTIAIGTPCILVSGGGLTIPWLVDNFCTVVRHSRCPACVCGVMVRGSDRVYCIHRWSQLRPLTPPGEPARETNTQRDPVESTC